MKKNAFNVTNIILILLTIIFISIAINYVVFNQDFEKETCDNAKLINTLGQIRGGTQRYVKLKISNKKTDELKNILNDKYIEVYKLINKNVIPKNDKKSFTLSVNNLLYNWNLIKKESNTTQLLINSENHWKLADNITNYAETISEKKISYLRKKLAISTTIVLFLIALISYIIYIYVKKGLEKERITDPLTKLYNRKYFEEIIKYFDNEYKRNKSSFNMIFIDIDHFKQINDNFGHQTGDEILKKVSNLIINNIRKTDFPFRYGGEEIVILMPKTNLENACKKTYEIKKIINENIILPNGKHLTFSAGVNEFKGSDIYEFIHKTDELMYMAKEAGRDKIICHGESLEKHK